MSRAFAAFALFTATTLLSGCAPGLAGNWSASGHVDVANAFDLHLTFQSDQGGLAVFATDAGGERAVPVCQVVRDDQRVAFVIDTQGNTTCTTLSQPWAFRGILGRHVLAGQVLDASGQPIGMWRAFRKADD